MLALAALGCPWVAATAIGQPAESRPTVAEILNQLDPSEAPRGVGVRPRALELQTVTFELNSSTLTPEARAVLDDVGTALQSPRLSNATIIIEGHTDASGRTDYNQLLSERRAQVVRSYLIENFHVSQLNLLASGFGETRLKNEADPNSSENRRVVFVRQDGR
jgi:outer membrane protein OmpA-like peptidoglycan-associated protein